MINAFYSGVSGAKTCQTRLDVSANNIANVSTTGFKAQQTTFTDLVYNNMAIDENASVILKEGSGVKIADTSPSLDQGNVEYTDGVYDVAILGEGYFAVGDDAGNISYTRSGNFSVQKNGDDKYLMTSNGEYVLDSELSPIVISGQAQNVQFTTGAQNAEASSQADSETESSNAQIINIGVFNFDNPYALSPDGYGKLSATAASGAANLYNEALIEQGALEGSNVDIATEMSNLLQAQRGFQFSSKVIQAADEMESIANTLR